MQVTVCKPVTLAAKAPKMPGRVATGFPLPSTGRGIEGEGWSYPEPPPARASDGGRSRAATPFACGAGTLWPGFAAGLRMTLLPSKQPSFPKASTAETSRPHAIPWAVGRVTPCAPRLPPAGAKFPRRRLPDPQPIKTLLEFPVPTSKFGFIRVHPFVVKNPHLNAHRFALKPEPFNLQPVLNTEHLKLNTL